MKATMEEMTMVFDVTITVFRGNKAIQRINMTAPRFMIEQQFMQFVREIAPIREPMRILMEREEVIWDQFEQKQKIIPCTLEFTNYNREENE